MLLLKTISLLLSTTATVKVLMERENPSEEPVFLTFLITYLLT